MATNSALIASESQFGLKSWRGVVSCIATPHVFITGASLRDRNRGRHCVPAFRWMHSHASSAPSPAAARRRASRLVEIALGEACSRLRHTATRTTTRPFDRRRPSTT